MKMFWDYYISRSSFSSCSYIFQTYFVLFSLLYAMLQERTIFRRSFFFLNSVSHWISYEELVFFFWNSEIKCLPPFPPPRWGGDVFQAPISNIKRFPSNFSFSIFFFLVAYCFLFLHFKALLQIVLLTSS